MRKLMAVFAVGAVLALAGCKNGNHNDKCCPTTQMSKKDCCSHCPGVQTATADGKCPVCGAKCDKM
jgi:hypothetical protein